MLLIAAVLMAVSAVLHPLLPEDSSRMARLILDAGHYWLLVHVMFGAGLMFALGGIRHGTAWVPVGLGKGRLPTLACLYVGPALLVLVIFMEITVLLADAPAAATGEALAARDHGRVFDVAAAVFHAGTAITILGLALWCVAARSLPGLARWWAVLGALASPFAFSAAVAATAFDAPWTLIIGIPALVYVVASLAGLGAILVWGGAAGPRRWAPRHAEG
ncbi:MAG TPA: hypothetical protein VI818_03335 [Candidatus Thermoplasmatota archaeon]|nr:hypothetical protein [Candidatus Thermoplasmatota archaeon]